MDKLVNDLGKLFEEFFRQEAGNRLSQFAWVSFKETTLNLVKTYKPEGKKENEHSEQTKKDVKP
jgi:hypothetical protein